MLRAKSYSKKVLQVNKSAQKLTDIGSKVLGLTIVGVITSALQGLANLGFPLLTKILIDRVLPSKKIELLLLVCVGFLIIAICIVGFSFLASYMGVTASEKITLLLREKIIAQAVNLGIVDECSLRASDNIVPLITVDAPMVGSIFGSVLQQGIFQIIRFVGAVFLIATINWRLLLIAPIMILLLTASPVLMRKRLISISRDNQEAESAVLTSASEFLTDLLSLRAAFATNWIKKVLKRRFRRRRFTQLRQQRAVIVSQVGYLGLWLVYSVTYFFGGWLAFQGKLSFGDVLALGQLMATLAFPSQSLGQVYSSYTTAQASLQRINEFLTQEFVDLFHKVSPTEVNIAEDYKRNRTLSVLPLVCCEIRAEVGTGVTVLQDVSIAIDSGNWVAVAGASGAGKSSLAQVLAGLRVPTNGSVMAGGKLLSKWNEEAFRSRVGFMNSNVKLYQGSLFENVVLGRKGISPEIVNSLLELVGAVDIVNRLGGIHSLQVEGWKKLSSGERQRIGIARAIAASPEVLILDEATSALDSQSEVTLFQNLREKFPKLTVMLISHRLSTVLECDEIVVLDRGKIVQKGLPSVLLSEKSLFRDLVQSQVVDSNRP